MTALVYLDNIFMNIAAEVSKLKGWQGTLADELYKVPVTQRISSLVIIPL